MASAARRYAKALFRYAKEQNALEAVTTDLRELRQLIEATPELARLVDDPVIPPAQARKQLHGLFESRVDPVTMRFLDFLVEKDRLEQLPAICRTLETLHNEAAGIVHATITTARTLSDQHQQAIRTRLEKKTGKQVIIHQVADEALIGGFTILVGDEVTDLSVRGLLHRLEQNIINA